MILEAASEAFVRNGYLGTSMDEVAAAAGVSKQTVYKHFTDKEQLFEQIVLGTIDRVGEPFYEAMRRLESADDLEGALRAVARRLMGIVMQPQVLQLRRLVIAEAGRFPKLGRTYYERGPGRTADALASRLEELGRRGLLRVDDAGLAAAHFLWLILSIPLNAVMFGASNAQFTKKELDAYADAGVRVFLAAYGAGGGGSGRIGKRRAR